MSDLEYTQKMREYNLLVSTKEYLLDETDKEAQAAIADAYLMYKQVVSEQKRKVAYARADRAVVSCCSLRSCL